MQMLKKANERFLEISKLNSISREMKAKAILWHGLMLVYYNGGQNKISFVEKTKPLNYIIENLSNTKCYDDAIFNMARLYHLQGRFAEARRFYVKLKSLGSKSQVYDVYLKKLVLSKIASAYYLGKLPKNVPAEDPNLEDPKDKSNNDGEVKKKQQEASEDVIDLANVSSTSSSVSTSTPLSTSENRSGDKKITGTSTPTSSERVQKLKDDTKTPEDIQRELDMLRDAL